MGNKSVQVPISKSTLQVMQPHFSSKVYEPADTAWSRGWGVNQTAITAVAFSGCPAFSTFSFCMSYLFGAPGTNNNFYLVLEI